MNKRDQYNLSFREEAIKWGDTTKFVTTNNLIYGALALHLKSCDEINVRSQLKTIDEVLNGNSGDFFWGEVMGSALEFHSDNTVEIGDGGLTIPILDFKELLEEWLNFIS